jgi:hypothetical protein
MSDTRTRRILVVTDHLAPTAAVTDAIRERTQTGDVQFRVDQQIDPALSAVRNSSPDEPTEEKTLSSLLTTLG